MRTLFDEAADTISCPEFVSEVMGRPSRDSDGRTYTNCPNDGQSTPAMLVTGDRFWCFHCDLGGSVIGLAVLHLTAQSGQDVSHVDAARWLLSR